MVCAATVSGCGGDKLPDAKIRQVHSFSGFVADKGNIGCVIDPESVRCDISKREWKPPKDKKKCEFDYGQGIWLDRGGEPEFVCAGDTALYAGDDLASGRGIRSGDITCVVKQATV